MRVFMRTPCRRRSAGMAKEDVTYINAHGTSTNYNDKVRW